MSAFDDIYHQTDSFLSALHRADLETRPILDQGKSSEAYIADAATQHRNAYVGMPIPGRHKHRKHKRKSDKGHKKFSKKLIKEEEPEDLVAPQQKVQFILGTENGKNEHPSGIWKAPQCSMPRLFTEMDELKMKDNVPVWKETARWIKFEECVEEGGDRWSKPHVASLSLHSLFELRSCILNGVVQLDMDAPNLEQIAEMVLDKMTQQGNFPHDPDLREKVKHTLLSGHKHQIKKSKTLSAIRSVADLMSTKKDSSSHLQEMSTSPSAGQLNGNKSGTLTSSPTDPDFEKKDKKLPYFMKKIPPGAEASNVLVGEVDFLEKPVIAFLRMQNSIKLDLSEVPIPTRFLFILLGPVATHKRQYQEIGRSIATLMADEVFHDVAYKARTRQDLLAGIDEFLDQVTVLPPGEWDASIRIEPPKDLPESQMNRLDLTRGSMKKEREIEAHGVGPELQRSGRLFGGLINDIKRKSKWYWSDFKDALSLQCVASFIFLYFAVLTPIVTFGGLLGDATHNNLAAMESIFGGCIAGCCYHLFSGQPLTIIGSTGPILVFESIMFSICESVNMEYLPFRWWVGVWTGLICIILVATDASSLIQYITRYTEESFSALISLIFIYEAFKKLIHVRDDHVIWHGWDAEYITEYDCQCFPPNLSNYQYNESAIIDYHEIAHKSKEEAMMSHGSSGGELYRTGNYSYVCSFDGVNTNVTDINEIAWVNKSRSTCMDTLCGAMVGESCPYTPDAMLMSVLLFFMTFFISTSLKSMKTSRFFPTRVRSIVSDFAVTIAIALMVVFDMFMKLSTPKLIVPDTFRPTRTDRKWFIEPLGTNEWYSIPLALIPAILATILIFMDQQITAVIVNRKENKLKKGAGYHLDLLIVSFMLILCSVLGLPWFVAATVLSITHVNSLKMESETSAPGEAAKFLGVREQRVTGFLIFLLIGLSVFLTPILKHIPMPVLYGVFLYMGVSSLQGVQFMDRMKLFFMPPKHQPDLIYLRHVPLYKVHIFTFIQLMGLVVLFVIKSIKPVNIIFPMMVVALIGVRKSFDYFLFTQRDLFWLDDIMPESTKKKKEDAKKKKELELKKEQERAMAGYDHGGVLQIQMKYDPHEPTSIDISKEMSRSDVWKTIAANELGSDCNFQRKSPTKKLNGDVPEKAPSSPDSGRLEMVSIHMDSGESTNGTEQDVTDV